MGSLVKDFQRDIVQSPKSTTELLRTAKLISVKPGLTDISEWINLELNGYQKESTIPPYRHISGGELQIRNPVHGWLPVEKLNGAFRVGQSVSELEALSASSSIVVSLSRNQNFSLHVVGLEWMSAIGSSKSSLINASDRLEPFPVFAACSWHNPGVAWIKH